MSRVSGRNVRTVPISLTKSGITLNTLVWLVSIEATVMTIESSGLALRLAMDCSAQMICAVVTTGSTVRCGMAACPPRPCTLMTISSVAAITGPGRTAI
jgi:hypothetical protein